MYYIIHKYKEKIHPIPKNLNIISILMFSNLLFNPATIFYIYNIIYFLVQEVKINGRCSTKKLRHLSNVVHLFYYIVLFHTISIFLM